jgi:hypothetical protein
MKLANMLLGVSLLVWMVPVLAQDPPAMTPEREREQRAEMRKEIGEAVDAIRSYSIERRKDAVAVSRKALDDADRRMERLQARLDADSERMEAGARQRSQEAMADLRRQKSDLADRGAKLQHASEVAWDDARRDFVDGYHAFVQALERARARVESGRTQQDHDGEEEEEER